jgi:hypothetical protein
MNPLAKPFVSNQSNLNPLAESFVPSPNEMQKDVLTRFLVQNRWLFEYDPLKDVKLTFSEVVVSKKRKSPDE